jgi:hypothetical protein
LLDRTIQVHMVFIERDIVAVVHSRLSYGCSALPKPRKRQQPVNTCQDQGAPTLVDMLCPANVRSSDVQRPYNIFHLHIRSHTTMDPASIELPRSLPFLTGINSTMSFQAMSHVIRGQPNSLCHNISVLTTTHGRLCIHHLRLHCTCCTEPCMHTVYPSISQKQSSSNLQQLSSLKSRPTACCLR